MDLGWKCIELNLLQIKCNKLTWLVVIKAITAEYALLRQGSVRGVTRRAECLKGINYFLESFNLIITASHAGSLSNKNSWTAPQYFGPN